MRRAILKILFLLPLLQISKISANVLTVPTGELTCFSTGATKKSKKSDTLTVSDIGINFIHLKWIEILELAQKDNKPIFVDCFTEWCGPCKTMSNTVFKEKSVSDYYNSTFINVKIDMEKGEGVAFKDKYGVSVFPTFLYLDFNGKVINRLVGSMKGSDFIALAKKGLSETGLAKMQDRYATGDRSAPFVLDYLATLDKAYLTKESQKVAKEFLRSLKPEEFYLLKTRKYWSLFEKYEDDVRSDLFNYIYDNRVDFYLLYNEKVVEKKFLTVWSSGSRAFITEDRDKAKFDKQGFIDYIELMKKKGVKDWQNIAIDAQIFYAEQFKEWNEYVKLVDSKIRILKPQNVSETSLYKWGLVIDMNCHDKKIRKKAARWFIEMIPIVTEKESLAREKADGSKAGEYELMSLVNSIKEFTRLAGTLRNY